MNDMEIMKLVFGILLSLGTIVLFVIAFKVFYKYLVQEKRCTAKGKGTIKKYTLFSYGGESARIHLPVVFYTVNGKEYKVVGPEYKAIKTKTKSTPWSENHVEYKVENQVLSINRTSNSYGHRYQDPIAARFPLNSEIDVYYDPNDPKLAYVLRYCNKKWAFWLTFAAGLLVLAADIMIQLMG